jgi:hypothetical protein
MSSLTWLDCSEYERRRVPLCIEITSGTGKRHFTSQCKFASKLGVKRVACGKKASNWPPLRFCLTSDWMSCHIKHMARGPSGRLVIEVDPDLKRNLHSALAADGTCLKDWFLGCVREYFTHRHQPSLPGLTRFPRRSPSEPQQRAAEDSGDYQTRKSHK